MTSGLLKTRTTKNKLFAKNLDNYKQYQSLYNKACRSAKFKYTRKYFDEDRNYSQKCGV